jgi:quercetin dioxygenase-like cupin family protein
MRIINTREVEPVSRFAGILSKPLINPGLGAGAVTVSELTIQPGSALPAHTHLVEEAFFIFQGTGEAIAGDEVQPVAPGTAILAPTGVPHGFRNTGTDELKMVCMYPAVNPTAFFDEQK